MRVILSWLRRGNGIAGCDVTAATAYSGKLCFGYRVGSVPGVAQPSPVQKLGGVLITTIYLVHTAAFYVFNVIPPSATRKKTQRLCVLLQLI